MRHEAPFKIKDIPALRVRLQKDGLARELVLCNAPRF